ncbi:hypothetical protein pb186bvf_018986 [Paramecium bursaria]
MIPNQFSNYQDSDYEKYVKVCLVETYYKQCINTCITEYDKPLSGQEKLCLAKCIDRSYDSLRLMEKNFNPLKQNQHFKYIFKLDGNNVLDLRTQNK